MILRLIENLIKFKMPFAGWFYGKADFMLTQSYKLGTFELDREYKLVRKIKELAVRTHKMLLQKSISIIFCGVV